MICVSFQDFYLQLKVRDSMRSKKYEIAEFFIPTTSRLSGSFNCRLAAMKSALVSLRFL